ncbi:MAG TPA: NAD(P)/FAD-dependent oxidoreductase [Acidimicrobiales bacterium]
MVPEDLGEAPVYDVAVVGAGVVGCAVARHLARVGASVVVLDRAVDVGDGTSKANTAILHTGFDTEPGSLESELVRRGRSLLAGYAAAAGIAVEPSGALLVAWDDEQEATLPSLLDRAAANGCDDASLVDADEVRGREPHLGPDARSGLSVPGEWAIDPWSVTLAFATEAVSAGADLRLGSAVVAVDVGVEGHEVRTAVGTVRARWLVNAAGLGADRIDGLLGHCDFTVTPRRGQLIVFDKLARRLLRRILLPVPTARTKGVLVSPTTWGNVLLGPTAEDVEDRDDTATTADGIGRLLAAGRRILPGLVDEEVTATYAGLRAATEHRDYQIRLHADQRYVTVGGIRSTGLTSSMAVAEHVAGLLDGAGATWSGAPVDVPTPVMPPLGELQVRPLHDPVRIAADPSYGTALCHCEQVSRGEVRDSCHAPVPATDLGGVRRRTRAMNGRCQGFYCGAEVVAQVAAETGIDPGELTRMPR